MAKGKPISGRPRLDQLTDEEIQRRWRGLTPIFIKCLILGIVAAPLLFSYNRVFHPGQTTVNFINVAFQIACCFTVLFAFLTAMSFLFGRGDRKPQKS